MRSFSIIIFTLFFSGIACTSFAAVELYSGNILIINSSGKACAEFKGEHAVDMVLRRDGGIPGVSGYFEGEGLATGRFSGKAGERLAVYYPYQEEIKASGHFISLVTDGNLLQAELNERHIEESAEECNFDLARLTLKRVGDEPAAEARFKRIATLFDAQLARSEALALVRKGQNDEALLLFEKALSLADSVANPDPKQLAPYITGLASAYVRFGRFKDFNRLYDERIDGLTDKEGRAFFDGHRVRALMVEGKAALGREEYDVALAKFLPAYRLHPQGRDTIAAVMATYVRAGKFESAITFLEEAMKGVDNEGERKEMQEAIALVLFQKSKKDEKSEKSAEAESSLKKALLLAPDNFHYLIALARLRHKLGNLDEAETILKQGLGRFKNEDIRREILAARDKMRQTDMILEKIRQAGS